MSEVDNHYGHDAANRPAPNAPAQPSSAAKAAYGKVGDTAAKVGGTAAKSADTVRKAAGQAYGQAADWASDNLDTASRNATYARRRTAAEFNRGRRNVESFVEGNPVMVGVAGLAAGLLLGALLPGTRQENRYLGRYADEVRNQGLRYAQDVAEQGRSLLEENLKQVKQGLAEPNRQQGA